MAGVKWSDDAYFPDGGDCQIGDVIMGLRSGGNYKFDFPSTGIKDGDGNYLFRWDTVGASATNYLEIFNGVSGTPTKIQALGSDSNIDIDIVLKGTGQLDITGLFNINGSTAINAVINDDTFATASATNVPTALSVKNYIAATPGGAGGSNTEVQWNNAGTLDGDSGFTTNGAGSVNIVGDLDVDNLNLNANTLSSTDVNGNIVVDPNGTGEIQLSAATVTIGTNLVHSGDTNNYFGFGTDTQDFQTGGSSRMDISDSGIRMGAANSRVTTILDEDNMISDSATALATQQSIKAYVDNEIGSAAGGSNGQLQYNNAGAFGGDSGVTTNGAGVWTGTLSITGQFNVDNLRLDGNTLSSTNTNGDINLTPDGSGQVVLDGVGWSSLTNGQLFIGNTGSVPTAATLTAGSGVSIANGAGSITISAGGGGGFTWNYVSGTSSATAAANGYITDNGATVTLTLPVSITRGQGIAVQNIGAGLVRIAQNASQYIKFGSSTSTVGVGGYVEVVVPVNGFILLCTETDLGFCFLTPPVGALTIV